MAAAGKVILLVEDSSDDVFFLKRALEKAGLGNPVQAVADVDQAMCYLEGTGPFSDRAKFPLPSIVMVDLQIPNKDGFDFLHWLGQKSGLRNLHVIVMSGVGRLQDINRAYQMGANSFLTKPVKEEDLRNLARGFAAYWT